MSGSASAKGNPASHRMSNGALKARRERSWKRSQVRKKARIDAQASRQAANKKHRAEGTPTPWQAAKAKRREARQPLRAAFLKRHPETA
jgi:hypothetical protein